MNVFFFVVLFDSFAITSTTFFTNHSFENKHDVVCSVRVGSVLLASRRNFMCFSPSQFEPREHHNVKTPSRKSQQVKGRCALFDVCGYCAMATVLYHKVFLFDFFYFSVVLNFFLFLVRAFKACSSWVCTFQFTVIMCLLPFLA